jgi:hypothetical protein
MFVVTKLFVEGTLKGVTYEDSRCPVPFEVGCVYGGGWTGPRYRVLACRKAA